MPSPNMKRGLVGKFPCGADPYAADQRVSPRPSDCLHICPYGRYWHLGTGEEDQRAAWADAGACGTAEWEAEGQVNETGTDKERREARRGEVRDDGSDSDKDDSSEKAEMNGQPIRAQEKRRSRGEVTRGR